MKSSFTFINTKFLTFFINYVFQYFREFGQLSLTAREQSNLEKTKVCERLNLLLDLLIAHKTLTERQDRGVISEHKRAVSTMLTLKTKQMQGALKGTDVSHHQHC